MSQLLTTREVTKPTEREITQPQNNTPTNTYFFPISPMTEAKAGLSLAVAYHLSRNAPRAVVSAAGGTSRRPRLPSPSCLEPILALRHAGEMHKVRGKVKTNKH